MAPAPLPPAPLPPPSMPPPPGGQPPPSLSLADHLKLRFRTRPGLVDLAMVLAAAGSYFHHVNGARMVAVLVWWVIWAGLWTIWGRSAASMLGAIVSVVVLAFMLVGPRTHLGFALQRDCFESKADAAIAAHDETGRTHYHGKDNCGLMGFDLQTQRVRIRANDQEQLQQDPQLSAWFRQAGEQNWGLFDGNGIAYSPGGRPFCTAGVVGDTHGCKVESIGDDWYYFWYSRNIN